MLIASPGQRAPPGEAAEVTIITDAGDSRMSCRPSAPAERAYVPPPRANTSMPWGPPSASRPPVPLATEPAPNRDPSPRTRISWTASVSCEVTAAYVPPLALLKAEMARGSPRMSRPGAPWRIAPAASSVPFS